MWGFLAVESFLSSLKRLSKRRALGFSVSLHFSRVPTFLGEASSSIILLDKAFNLPQKYIDVIEAVIKERK